MEMPPLPTVGAVPTVLEKVHPPAGVESIDEVPPPADVASVTSVTSITEVPPPSDNESIKEDIEVTVPLLPPWSNADRNWVIKGVEELDADGLCHMSAFYTNLNKLISEKNNSIAMLTKKCYDERVEFCMSLAEGGDCRSAFCQAQWLRINGQRDIML
jgi:hypothetical protein